MKLFRILVPLTMLCVGSCAFGATIIEHCTATPFPTLTDQAPSATATLSCPQFDPSLGTLTSYAFYSPVSSVPQAQTNVSFTLHNGTGSTISSGFGIVYEWTLSTFAGFVSSTDGWDFVGPITLAPGATATFNVVDYGAGVTTYTQTAGMDALVGTGTFQFGSILANSHPDGNALPGVELVSYTIDGPDSSNQIVYTYTPEPASVSLMLLGGGLLALRLKKR